MARTIGFYLYERDILSRLLKDEWLGYRVLPENAQGVWTVRLYHKKVVFDIFWQKVDGTFTLSCELKDPESGFATHQVEEADYVPVGEQVTELFLLQEEKGDTLHDVGLELVTNSSTWQILARGSQGLQMVRNAADGAAAASVAAGAASAAKASPSADAADWKRVPITRD